ncbi:hypothetical protein PRNP1_000258 [Phytophthora ramorum]
MSGAGLRNWRGEIVEAKATPSAGDRDKGGYEADAVGSRSAAPVTPLPLNARDLASEERRPSQQKVLRKDEFGRDVEVVVDEKRRKKSEVGDRNRRVRRVNLLGHRRRQIRSVLSLMKHDMDARSDTSERGVLVEIAAVAGTTHTAALEAEVEVPTPETTVATAAEALREVVAEAEPEVEAHPLSLVAGARRPPWSAGGHITPSTVAAQAHHDKLIHSIVLILRPGYHVQGVSTCLANSFISRKRRSSFRVD